MLESIYDTCFQKAENSWAVLVEGYEPSSSWGPGTPDLTVEFWLGLNTYPMERPAVTVAGGGLPFDALKSINEVTLAENWEWNEDRAGEPVCFEVVEAIRDGIAEWISEYEVRECEERKRRQCIMSDDFSRHFASLRSALWAMTPVGALHGSALAANPTTISLVSQDAKKREEDKRKKEQREKAKKDAEEQRQTKKVMTEPERRQYAKQQLGNFASAQPTLPKSQKTPSHSNQGVREVDLVKDLFS